VSGQRTERLVRAFDQVDLAACCLLAMAALLATALGSSTLLRTALAIPLVLFLPGYGLVNALFPALVLPAVERLLLAIGSSIAITILVGLALAGVGADLMPVNWALSLAVLTIAVALVAWGRRAHLGIAGPRPGFVRMMPMGALMLFVAALITVDTLVGSALIANQQDAPAVTQLWMVPVDGQPTEALLGVRAGAVGGQFTIKLSSSGSPVEQFDMRLQPGEAWERQVTFAEELRQKPIVARLYQGGSESELRFVVLQPSTNAT